MALFRRKKSAENIPLSSNNDQGERLPSSRSKKRSLGGIVVFLVSVGLGLVGMFYSQTYIEDKVDHYKSQLVTDEKMVELIVPGRRMLQGETINQSDLQIREVPLTYADANSIGYDSFSDTLGRKLAFDVEKGTPLLWAHLEGGKTATFSGLVPEGARALTVRVDEINSISGFLQPGDRIDLLMTHGVGNNNSIFPLIQNLDVIATGVQTSVDKNAVAGPYGSTRNFATITVNVSPENAQKITLAQKIGKLTAVLRNPEDAVPIPTAPMTTTGLLRKKPVVKNKPAVTKKKPAIEYIIGGA